MRIIKAHHDSSSGCFTLTETGSKVVLCLEEGSSEIARSEWQCIGVKPSGGKTGWLFMCINKMCVRMVTRYNPDH